MAVIADLVQENTLVEEYGELTEALRVFLVTGVTGVDAGAAMASALVTIGIPVVGDSISVSFPNCRVERRTARLVGQNGSTATVRVDVEYRLQRPEAEAATALRGGASLNQVRTQVDRDGEPITLTYAGETIRAEVDVLDARNHFSTEFVKMVASPEAYAGAYVNHVNNDEFRGDPIGTWLCTNCDWEMVNPNTDPNPTYRFSFEFEKRDGGHVYTVAWKDEDGTIPEDVVEGEGIKDIDWHQASAFGDFGSQQAASSTYPTDWRKYAGVGKVVK